MSHGGEGGRCGAGEQGEECASYTVASYDCVRDLAGSTCAMCQEEWKVGEGRPGFDL